MKLGELDIKKAYFGVKELTSNNAYLGDIPIKKNEGIPNNEIWYWGEYYDLANAISLFVQQGVSYAGHAVLTNKKVGDKYVITFDGPVNKLGTFMETNNFYPIFMYVSGMIECNITRIEIPNSVAIIGSQSFYGCQSLTSITIPNSVTNIGDGAFYYCSSLTSVTIPSSVTNIGYDAFNGILNIMYSGSATGSPWGAKSVNGYVDDYLVYNDSTKTVLLGCSLSAIGEIIIPNSVISIGEGAFKDCSGLTLVTISNSVTNIGNSAFSGCSSLTSVTIGNSITSIENYAFRNCSSLTSISYTGTIAQWNAITKGYSWKINIPATVVHCSDGDVAL